MPTGYTAELKEMKFDVKRWLKESAIRAMGVCVMMRDSGKKTQKELEKAMRSEESYHGPKLKEAMELLSQVKRWGHGEWVREYERERARAQKAYDKRLKEHNEEKEAHAATLNEIRRMQKSAHGKSDIIVNTLKFASDQVSSGMDFDYGHKPYREDILDQSLDEFRKATIDKAQEDVEYHRGKLMEDDARTKERADAYAEFVKFVDSV